MATKKSTRTNADPDDIARFRALATDWWNPEGPMAPLHRMNPTRMEWLLGQIRLKFKTLKNIKILDVGCGGGLVSEPLARLGASVTGIDGAAELIAIATQHAAAQNLAIDYRAVLTDRLIAEKKTYDIIIASEVIEHVPDPQAFIHDISKLLKPDGMALFSTLNRTPESFAFGIVAAEYILGWLPQGTHNWKQFVKPSELYRYCQEAGLTPLETCGMRYHPATKRFTLDAKHLRMNYFLSAIKA